MKEKLEKLGQTIQYPLWKRVFWRWIRVSIATGISQTLLLKPTWQNPIQDVRLIGIAFLSGFIVSMAMAIRDKFSEEDKSNIINKIPL